MNSEHLRALWRGYTPGLLGRQYDCAVLCPFIERTDGLHLLFEVRAATLRNQPGVVCFPGGRTEVGETAIQCALRETAEELAVSPKHVQIFGQSDFLCQPGKFLLQPVLGLLSAEGVLSIQPSPSEVAEVFTVPFDFFKNTPPQLHVYTMEPKVPVEFPYDAVGVPPTYSWGKGAVEVPIWNWQGHVIWGMTGRIVKNLVETMDASSKQND